MTQIIFYKCIQFPIELLVAEFLFTFRLARRRYFLLRYIAVLAVCAAVFVFFPLPSENAFYVSFMYLALFAVTVAAHKFAYKERWIIILFCCVAGYTVQHFAYELYNIVLNLLGAADRPSMNIYGSGRNGRKFHAQKEIRLRRTRSADGGKRRRGIAQGIRLLGRKTEPHNGERGLPNYALRRSRKNRAGYRRRLGGGKLLLR